ncbi:Syntaxin-18 [Tetrabaena socialis]|uniref:Syntaxin-18 n=1 Tax=Tetrabaena socialis TaxID=47790 RepID=A0A2J8A1K0_9CHLO|nr:Syntaxin-18 [Tetrabaena socialis]|eukprot:PNH06392.1 Syntaxin-18 [Tetrabaena socialis]
MDRTTDLMAAAERFLTTASLPPEQAHKLRAAVMLRRSAAAQSSFAVAAKGVEDSIRTLWDSIRSIQREYTEPGAMTSPDPAKDANEAQVAAFISRIGGYIERLKQAAAAAQGPDRGRVNEHTSAHMHGVVLILAERLHRATMCFDRLRAARYQALLDSRGPAAGSSSSARAAAGAAGGPAGRQDGLQRGSLDAGAVGTSRRGPVAGARAAALAAARSGWQHIVGAHAAGVKGHGDEATDAAAAAAAADGDGSARAWPVQVQEVEQENKALLEHLTATRGAARSVEQSVRDVAALNQMFSAAVLAQAETIETIYLAAVEATHHITAGNVSLTKTVAVNRSTSRYLLVLLLVAALCLLFFDWFNS